MKKLMLALVAAAVMPAMANELDNPMAVSAKQIELAKDLPQTVVIRRSKSNPNDIAVVHSKEKIAAGKKLTKAQFETIALNAEMNGRTAANELDQRSSTSSWSFGLYYNNSYYRRPYYGYGYNNYYPRNYYGYGYGRNYYPSYNYYGYRYQYTSYYSYSDSYYDYDYCNWYY